MLRDLSGYIELPPLDDPAVVGVCGVNGCYVPIEVREGDTGRECCQVCYAMMVSDGMVMSPALVVERVRKCVPRS